MIQILDPEFVEETSNRTGTRIQVPIWPIGKQPGGVDEPKLLADAVDAYINDQAEGSNKKLAAFLRENASGIAVVMAIGEVAGPRFMYSVNAKRLRAKNARTLAYSGSGNGRSTGASDAYGGGVPPVNPRSPDVVSAFAPEENS